MNAPADGPRRELGAFTCVAIGLSVIVGGGIFVLPPALAESVGPLSFLAFALAGVVVGLIGLMTAEAAGTTDRAGGAYEYARLAFGPWTGFSVAWLAWINTTMALAGISLGFAKLLDVFAPGAASGRNMLWVATGVLAALGALNALGARPGAALSNVLAVAKVVPLIAFIVVAMAAFDASSFEGSGAKLASAGAGGLGTAAFRCIFAASGFETIGAVAGDVRAPQRVIPRAVLIAIGASTLLYVMVQLAATSAVPDLASISPADSPGSLALPVAAERAGARLGSPAFASGMRWLLLAGGAVSILGTCAAGAIVSPRYLFALAGGGFVPGPLARVDTRGTPVLAIAAATAVSVALVWNVGWLALIDASVLASLAQHAVTTLAAWRLRCTVPTAGRFVAPGGPLFPLLSLAAIASVVALAIQGDRVDERQLLALAGVLGAGLAVAAVCRSLAGRRPRANGPSAPPR